MERKDIEAVKEPNKVNLQDLAKEIRKMLQVLPLNVQIPLLRNIAEATEAELLMLMVEDRLAKKYKLTPVKK